MATFQSTFQSFPTVPKDGGSTDGKGNGSTDTSGKASLQDNRGSKSPATEQDHITLIEAAEAELNGGKKK